MIQSWTAFFPQHRFEIGNNFSLQHSEFFSLFPPYLPIWHSSVVISSSRLPSTILDKALPPLVEKYWFKQLCWWQAMAKNDESTAFLAFSFLFTEIHDRVGLRHCKIEDPLWNGTFGTGIGSRRMCTTKYPFIDCAALALHWDICSLVDMDENSLIVTSTL